MVKLETIQKHVKFLNKLQKEIKNNKGEISLNYYAKTYGIGQQHMQAYKNAGIITKINKVGRNSIFEFSIKKVHPIMVRKILENSNSLYKNTYSSGVDKKQKRIACEKPIVVKEKQKHTYPPIETKVKEAVNELGIIRTFIKWLW
jgi:hypothetical protein